MFDPPFYDIIFSDPPFYDIIFSWSPFLVN